MADAAAKRREFRRKRILENAENRLLRLTNLDNRKENDPDRHDQSEVEKPTCKENCPIQSEPIIRDNELCYRTTVVTNPTHNDDDENDDDIDGLMSNTGVRNRFEARQAMIPDEDDSTLATPDVVVNHPSITTNHPTDILMHHRKAFAAILALIVRIVLYFSQEITIFKYILMPITTFEICIFVASSMSKDMHSRPTQFYLSALLLLLGIKNGAQIAHAYNVFATVFEDYALFLFTFFVSHSLIESFAS